MFYDEMLNRGIYKEKILDFLNTFETKKDTISQIKRGMYLFGKGGIGKTTFIKNILKEMEFDMVYYDSSDVRNKSILDVITTDNMSNVNVHSMFMKKRKKIVIVMDDIDGMNSGDKGGINTLIKLIRPKKTKKQRLESITTIPIICIGGIMVDKKIKELMSVCTTIELNTPNMSQIEAIVKHTFSAKDNIKHIVSQVGTDLRKIKLLKTTSVRDITNPSKTTPIISVKSITREFLNNPYELSQHEMIIDTDRTTMALLWHENVIDMTNFEKNIKSIELYGRLLDNICFADYIDRLMFQKQIWEFNEITSLIKTMYNNHILHNSGQYITKKHTDDDIRFTKVLTKYSSEYNNMVFINNVCQSLNMTRNDMMHFILEIQELDMQERMNEIIESTDLTKLDIYRLCKYVNFVKYGEHIEVD